MKCPRCAIDLRPSIQDAVPISKCSQCEGIWLKQAELNAILHHHENELSPELIQETLQLAHVGLTQKEKMDQPACASCATPMTALNYNYNSGIIMHSCPSQHGLWLDHDKLEGAEANIEYWEEQKKNHDQEWRELIQKNPPSEPTPQGVNKVVSILSSLFSKDSR